MSIEIDKLWKHYEIQIDLYKFYIEVTIKLNTFHFAVSGAILSYYFANNDIASLKFSLLLPALMSLGLTILFSYGAVMNKHSRNEIFALRDAIGLKTSPELMILTVLLVIFAVANLITFSGIMYVVCAG